MALTKTTLASAGYIVPTGSPQTAVSAFTPAVEAQVEGSQLIVGERTRKPGVFTQGTPYEPGILQNDSNA